MIDYIKSLACEGETALFLRQKPILIDKKQQFHPNGVLKCVFVPGEPKAGQSWYGNTGSFIDDGRRVSASAANITHVLWMMLDDIGTKSKVPPLPPTSIIETSPGNFQYGYAFVPEEQPNKADFTAAIRAIADAGYTDPGACNPVRNFRIPGSVNLKNGFVSRLVEFHPERQFTLSQIIAAFGVTPGASDTGGGHRSIILADTGSDDVLAWLSAQGYVLSPPNPSGWAGVVCPNQAEHTDGVPEGRYAPLERLYCCLHAHCDDWNSERFLDWVAASGGPEHHAGLRPELLATKMAGTLAKLTPTPAYNADGAAAVQAEVEMRELGRLSVGDWHKSYAYVMSDDSYFDLKYRRAIPRAVFNALYRHIDTRSTHGGETKPRVSASILFDQLREPRGSLAFSGLTYAAGQGAQVDRDGELFGNRWRNARPVVSGGDPSPWLRHCELLLPDPAERAHCFDVMAYKLQHPAEKINHAILLAGTQGSGKDTMFAPFLYAIGGPASTNVSTIGAEMIASQFNEFLESEVIVLNELHDPDGATRRALANRLKPIIAAPPMYLGMNRKNVSVVAVVNRALVLAWSNDPIPIQLDSQDRRWFCVKTHAPRMTPEAGAAIWRWFAAGGLAACAAWLRARDVSAFAPGAAPPVTDYKLALLETGMTQSESFIVEMIRARSGPFAAGVIASPYHALCRELTDLQPAATKPIPQIALLHALTEAGWQDRGWCKSSEHPSRKQMYAAPGHAALSASELRRLYAGAGKPTVAAAVGVLAQGRGA